MSEYKFFRDDGHPYRPSRLATREVGIECPDGLKVSLRNDRNNRTANSSVLVQCSDPIAIEPSCANGFTIRIAEWSAAIDREQGVQHTSRVEDSPTEAQRDVAIDALAIVEECARRLSKRSNVEKKAQRQGIIDDITLAVSLIRKAI